MAETRSFAQILAGTSEFLFPAELGERPVTLDSRSSDGDTPLHVPMWQNDIEGVQGNAMLVERSMNPRRIMQSTKYKVSMICVIGLGLLVAVVAFQSIARRIDVPGNYTGHHWRGLETLLINPDGTFNQTFRLQTGEVLNTSGRWSITGDRISSSPFLYLSQDGRYKPHNVGCFTTLWNLERNRLFFGEDGEYFVAKGR